MRWINLVLIAAVFGDISLQILSLVEDKSAGSGQNHAPKVTITTPEHNSNFRSGLQIPYSIEVFDVEDGESRYVEIVPNEVFMEVWFFPSEQEMIDANKQSITIEDTMGLQIIKESGCFNCHRSKTALVGPAFYKIARRYLQQDVDELASSVFNGSSGNWSSAIMPAQVDITEIDARQAVHWILSNGGNEHRSIYAGITGSFPTRPEATKGVYVLKASYTDHGVDGNQETRLNGSDRVVLYIQ